MKRSYTYLKGLLTLALAALTGGLWATTYTSLPSYTITSASYATLTSPVLMPETAVDSFTVTIMWTGGNQRSDISQVKLIDPETDTQVAVDTHDGFSGGNKQNHVYTLSNIPADYAGKVLLVKSTVKCNEAGGTSTCRIDLSNGVTHTDYTDITEVIAINFASDKQALDTTAEGNLGFVTADGVQGAQVALAKWNNASGGNSTFEYTITVAGAKTETTYSLTYSAPNSWESKSDNTFNTPIGNLTKGYLDVSNHGNGIPNISLAGMPTTGYDVAVILSGDGETFGAVTVNGKDYIGSNGKTIAGAASWGSRQSYETLAEGQNVVFVTEQSAEILTVVGQATASNARASIAGLMVFFRKIPPSQACIYTVTDEGGSWDVTPTTEKPCVATIAFGETTGKSVDLATILVDVKSLKSLTITGTNGGTIANTDGVTAASVNINTNVKIPSSFATPAVTTIGEGALAYFTGETTTTAQSFPYSGNRHFETIKFQNQDNVGSGIENYTIAANETMLFTRANVRYIEALTLDGGLLKTTGNAQAWFGGAANKSLTMKAGIADFTSVTTDNDSSAVLIGYSGNGHTLDIQGGLLDASNTSIVGWELNSKYRQSGGLVKTKGFRQNGDRITEMTLTGGTIELGVGGIPNLGMANVTLGAATIRATADATIAEALNVTGAATLQAVDGKTLTVSGAISGEGTIAIGGPATTKVRADDGTYSDATVNATGTVDIGTNRPKIASIAEGATLKITLTDAELENGISWTVGENLTTEEANRLEVVGAELDNITVTNGTLTATLASSLAASWENGTWSKTPVTGSPVTITFSEGNTTCTFTNTEAIELATLTIKGEVAGEIVLGDYAVAVSAMTVEPAEVTIPVALFNTFSGAAYEVASDKTLKLKGNADVTKNMAVKGTLALDGNMNLSGNNVVYNGGTLDVVSGESTFNTQADVRGFQNGCTVKVASGATLKNGKADAPGYNNVTLDIAGTLEVTNGVRWSLGSTSSTTLREGAVLKGTGENDGAHEYAFDYFKGATITVDGDAKIEGNIGAHDGGTIIFNVTSGKTLTIEGAVKAGSLATSDTGTGTLVLANENTYTGGTTIANGSKLVVTHASALGSGDITLDGALTFKDVEMAVANNITQADPDAETPTGSITIDNSTVTLKGANGYYKGAITVNTGATLKSVTNNYAPFGNGSSIVNNGAIVVENSGNCAIAASMSGNGTLTVNSGNLYLFGANTYKGATTIAEGATVNAQTESGATWNFNNVTAEPDVTVNGTLNFVSTSELYRGFAGTGTINIKGNVTLGNTGNRGELTGLSRFTGNLVVDAEKTLTLITWGNPYNIALASLELNGAIAGQAKGGNASTLSLTTQALVGTGTINIPVTLADGATLAGAVTVNNTVTIDGTVTIAHADEAGETVITCNNAADIVASLPTAPATLKYEIVNGNTIVLAVAEVTVTLPNVPANTTWWYDGEEVTDGTITFVPGQAGKLILKADNGYVFADGTTSKEVTVNAGENGAEVKLPENSTAAAPVAQVEGGKQYQTLQAAIDAAEAGAEVTVIAGIVTDGPITVTKQVTVNLNNQTIVATNDKAGDGVFYVVAGGDLTINGEGTVNALGQNGWCMAIWARNGGKVTINGGTYTNVGAYSEEDGDHFDLIYVRNGGSVIINGGTFICETPAWTLNSHNTEKGTISVTGGKFYGLNPADIDTDDGVTTWCADGHIAVAEGEYYVVVKIPETAVAMIGKADYDTLAEAIGAATPGQTITLVKDIEVAGTDADRVVIDKSIILDGNGKTITAKDTSVDCRAINIVCDGAVKLYDLTVVAAGQRAINVIQKPVKLTMDEVTLTAANYAVNVASSADGAVISIADSTLNGLNIVNIAGPNTEVLIEDTTLNLNDTKTEPSNTFAALCLNKDATNASIAANDCIFNITSDDVSPSVKAKNSGAVDGTITIDGSSDEVGSAVALVLTPGSNFYLGCPTFEKAATMAVANDTIKLVADVTVQNAVALKNGVTLDLNGKTFTADIAGTIKMNGGTFATSDYVMVGANGKYSSTDAVFTIAANATYDMTVTEGTLTLNEAQWWTLEGQTITIAEGAAIVIPAGKTLGINGSTIVVNGTATVAGEVQLLTKESTVKAADADLNVTTTVAGCEVKYVDDTYTVVKSIVVPPAIADDETISDENKAALEDAMSDAGITEATESTFKVNGEEATAEEVADVLAVFEGITIKGDEEEKTVSMDFEFGVDVPEIAIDPDTKKPVVTVAPFVEGATLKDGAPVTYTVDGDEVPADKVEDGKLTMSVDDLVEEIEIEETEMTNNGPVTTTKKVYRSKPIKVKVGK